MFLSRDLLKRKVGESAETTKALAHDAPFALVRRKVFGQQVADCFAVTDNVVGTEVLQVFSLLDGITLAGQGRGGDSRAQASATLVHK